MALHGSIGEFDAAKETWLSYIERVEEYFIANDLGDGVEGKKRAILLSSCGHSTYQVAKQLFAPRKLTECTYAEVSEKLTGYFSPIPRDIVQRCKFNARIRQPGETVAEFCADLRRIAEFCDFGTKLEEMLRDRLVCGISDKAMQRRLLSETGLDFQKAYDLAVLMESTQKDTEALQKEQSSSNPAADVGGVHVVRSDPAPSRTGRKSVPSKKRESCYRCGGQHLQQECRFRTENCRCCGKKGHIARVCRSRGAKKTSHGAVNQVTSDSTKKPDPTAEYEMFQLTGSKTVDPLMVTVNVNQAELSMEVDTGAAVSVISEKTYWTLWTDEQRPQLKTSPAHLKTYSGQVLGVRGAVNVFVSYRGQHKELSLVVVEGTGLPLLGRDWLATLKLDWKEVKLGVNSLAQIDPLQSILADHKAVFEEELGLMRDVQVSIQIDPDAQPRYHRPRPVPYALRSKVDAELDRLVEEGVLEPVAHAKWAAPIVPVIKKDGSVRICGDFKVTINPSAQRDMYPLPKVDDLLATLSGGKLFSKLDLSHAYQQLQLSEESKPLVTVNTTKGLFQYTRLPFGVSTAPSIFQRTMENLLKDIPHVVVYIDDILVTGKTKDEHLENLKQVLSRLMKAGIRLKKEKCQFLLPKVSYLGYVISLQGISPSEEKVQAVREAPIPTNVTQLKSFLGMLNYYSRFLPNLSAQLSPLHKLLHKKSPWCWKAEQQHAFEEAKASLTSSCVLTHYSQDLPILISCDASQYGIGAVLAHKMSDGSVQPVAYASRSLAPAEKNYAQIDREGLAIIFAVTKFRQFLLGRHFTIQTDHKPLIHLFSPSRAVTQMASARIKRWSLQLSAFDYEIDYKCGDDNADADALSRLPLPHAPTDVPMPGEQVLLLETLPSPITASQIRQWTNKDSLFPQIRNFVQNGWPASVSEDMQPYYRRRSEISILDGCLLWGSRIIIPPAGRSMVLDELHETHPGISRIKSLARSYIWWPKLDADLEARVKKCPECQEHQHNPQKAPLHSWDWPERPWARLHMDYAGPCFGNKYFLVIVDAHSKWLEIVESRSTSESTVTHLRSIFSTHGLPEIVVSDNGPAFIGEVFKEFLSANGIRHITSAPYHPSTNGLAEKAVQTFKSSMKKSSTPIAVRLSRFLFRYRITPHTSTGRTPAEMLMGRRLRSRLTLMLPNSSKVLDAQDRQKAAHDQHAKFRSFNKNDSVYIRNFSRRGPTWIKGTIVEQKGPLSYVVQTEERSTRRHVDHIRPNTAISTDDNLFDELPFPFRSSDAPSMAPTVTTPPPPPRRSYRQRKQTQFYSPSAPQGRNVVSSYS